MDSQENGMTARRRKTTSPPVTAEARTAVRTATGRGRIVVGYALIGSAFAALVLLLPSSAGYLAPDLARPVVEMPATAGPAVSLSAPPVPTQGSAPLRITYPAVGMDLEVLPLAPETAGATAIVPPPTLDAYWLTPYGSPGRGSTNTTYIVGHSWEDRASVFNNLSLLASPGDQLTLTTAQGTLTYTVNAISTENKDTLKDSHIWAKVPGHLVLVSCYTADFRGKNIVIEAAPLAVPED